MSAAHQRKVTTRRGITCSVHQWGQGKPIVFFHGAGGLAPREPVLESLGERFLVLAPVWPGYGEEPGEDQLEDMLDFALHGWDLVEALGLTERPHLMGHSMGGMIAAEMAAINPQGLDRLVLLAAAGLWLDSHPIPDLFAMMPHELARVLFVDAEAGERVLTGGLDFNNLEALKQFLVLNSRRMGTAGKILFPIPNRRVAKRLYRLTSDTLVVWGEQDGLIPPVYGERWTELLPYAKLERIDQASHMLLWEQPAAVVEKIDGFLR